MIGLVDKCIRNIVTTDHTNIRDHYARVYSTRKCRTIIPLEPTLSLSLNKETMSLDFEMRTVFGSILIAPKGLLCRDVQKIMCVRPSVRSSVRPFVRMFWGPFLDLKIPVSPLIVPFGRSKKRSRA